MTCTCGSYTLSGYVFLHLNTHGCFSNLLSTHLPILFLISLISVRLPYTNISEDETKISVDDLMDYGKSSTDNSSTMLYMMKIPITFLKSIYIWIEFLMFLVIVIFTQGGELKINIYNSKILDFFEILLYVYVLCSE